MAHLLSKSTYIRGQQCQKSLYLNKKRPFLRDKISPEQLAKFKRGTDVGILAQSLFPGGVDCKPKSPAQYAAKIAETASMMTKPDVHTIYEAVFQWDEVLIILDILVRHNTGWHAYEVKSSVRISETYLQDAALQYYVLTGSGVKLHDFSMIHLDADYVFQEKLELHKLFKTVSVLEEVQQRFDETGANIRISKTTLEADSSPKIPIGPWCHSPYPCDFIGHCWKHVPANSFLYLDTISEEERFEWHRAGLLNICDLPDNFGEEASSRIQAKAFKTGKICFETEQIDSVLQLLNARDGSESYVFVLTHSPAIPLLSGARPFESIPLAICILSRDRTFIHHHLATSESMRKFAVCLAEISRKGMIFTDDSLALEGLYHFACKYTESSELAYLPRMELAVVGLQQLISGLKIYFPVPMKDTSLNDRALWLSGRDFKLKNETFLVRDLTQAETEPSFADSLQQLMLFPEALKAAFDGIGTLKIS